MASAQGATANLLEQVGNDNKLRILIRELKPEDAVEVGALVVDSIMAYAKEHTHCRQFYEDYVRHALADDDLSDLANHYMNRDTACFFVVTATAESDDPNEVIIGCAAVEKKGESNVELRRVSVKAEYRRYGIGKLLVNRVTEWARQHKYATIVLTTAALHSQAVRFYESLGYTLTSTTVVCADPYFEFVHYEKQIEG